jgi:imidazolonepropionase-like amidohydrolase
MKNLLFVFYCLFTIVNTNAQLTNPINGVPESKSEYIGIKGATVIVSSSEVLKNADILIENGRIKLVGHALKFPKGTLIHEFHGEYIFPAFIELNSSLGIKPRTKENKGNPYAPQFETSKSGPYYWNESIHPELRAADLYGFENKEENKLTDLGFGFVVAHLKDGVARGTAPLIALGDIPSNEKIIQPDLVPFFSLHKGSSQQTYPSSQMGAIALLKQAIIDAKWYAETTNESVNISMESLKNQLKNKLFFEATDKLEVLLISKILKEFSLQAAIICGGDEYQRIEEIKAAGHEYILPLKFPDALDVSNPYIAKEIPLSKLKHWEMAPANPFIFYAENIPFALSSSGIEKEKDFWKAIHQTIERGLPWEKALEALTTTPAKMIAFASEVGTIESGKFASFSVYSENPFTTKNVELLEKWNLGIRTIVKKKIINDIRGTYNLKLTTKLYTLKIEGELEKLTAKVYSGADYKVKEKDTSAISCTIQYNDRDVVLQFNANDEHYKGAVLLNGKTYPKLGAIEGSGMLPTGEWITWTAIKNTPFKVDKKDVTTATIDTVNRSSIWFPHVAFGRDSIPVHNTYFIRNATLWTGEDDGVIENGDLLVVKGKIKHVGKGTFNVPAGAKVIDAKGKYVTAGIIDEHSHIAISKGVNESGQSNTAEVSIGDVINPDDINIYRQLAGGVTCSQLLHGSANAIGGQSAIIKLKWGYGAEDLLLDNAPKFIKFALGENVKQTNWGDFNTIRFPQTRMGVEQVYYDAFHRAKVYMEDSGRKKKGVVDGKKKDLELEVMAEILRGERFITCHSYVQSEINMLMKVADSMGFTLNTFTHILEGYKLADKMREHGAGGSTFADWWAYKYEVIDAIPHNASLLTEQGVVTAINSDDAEMGRRLNQEAAKSLKYGGMSPHEAWKLVTLNPAKLLHLDNRMGSLKVGKDADVVIWSDEPLSVNARVEQTFIDGILLYDLRNQELENKRNDQERARIISRMLEAAKSGEKVVPYQMVKQPRYHCDTEETETEHHHGHAH